MKQAYIEKQKIIDEIKEKFENAQSAVVVDYMGITVEQADSMRSKLREAEVDYTVYKNTLVKRAIAGTDFEALAEVLEGPSAFAFSSDATAPARVLNEAIKEFNKMEFKGGFVEGEYYDKDALKQVASIPSRDVLISKFMGSIQSPIANFARVVAQIAETRGDEPEAAAEAPAEAEAPKEAEAPVEAEAAEAPAAEGAPAEEAAEAPAEEAAEAPAEEAPAEE
jgi:large subunit ribosomal protein L10